MPAARIGAPPPLERLVEPAVVQWFRAFRLERWFLVRYLKQARAGGPDGSVI
jgi:hypothetical protein